VGLGRDQGGIGKVAVEGDGGTVDGEDAEEEVLVDEGSAGHGAIRWMEEERR